MVLKRQTVWLLTMLSLMVVLSAYYLFNHEPVDMNDYALLDQEEELDSLGDVNSDMDMTMDDTVSFFLSQRYEADTNRAKLMSEYEEIIKSDAPAQQIAEAVAKQEFLHEVTEAEYTIESLLRQQGYEEAVVIAESDSVEVVVRSDSLDPKQVLQIISIVREHLQVNGNQVAVSYK